jgi:hypothetical protein
LTTRRSDTGRKGPKQRSDKCIKTQPIEITAWLSDRSGGCVRVCGEAPVGGCGSRISSSRRCWTLKSCAAEASRSVEKSTVANSAGPAQWAQQGDSGSFLLILGLPLGLSGSNLVHLTWISDVPQTSRDTGETNSILENSTVRMSMPEIAPVVGLVDRLLPIAAWSGKSSGAHQRISEFHLRRSVLRLGQGPAKRESR